MNEIQKNITFTTKNFTLSNELNNYKLLTITSSNYDTLNTNAIIDIQSSDLTLSFCSFALSLSPLCVLISPEIPTKIFNDEIIITIMAKNIPLPEKTSFTLILAEDLGIAGAIFFIQKTLNLLQKNSFTIFSSTNNFPCKIQPSKIMNKQLPKDVIAGATLLEDYNLPNRLASLNEKPGVFTGSATDLADHFIYNTTIKYQVYAFGSKSFCDLCTKFAINNKFNIYQLSTYDSYRM